MRQDSNTPDDTDSHCSLFDFDLDLSCGVQHPPQSLMRVLNGQQQYSGAVKRNISISSSSNKLDSHRLQLAAPAFASMPTSKIGG